MKKLTAALLTLMMLTSCSSKTNEELPEQTTTEPSPVGDVTVISQYDMPEYIEVTSDDFTVIPVNISFPPGDPPVEVERLETTKIGNIWEVISCTTIEEGMEHSSYGQVDRYRYCDDKAYFSKSYDYECFSANGGKCHTWAIYEFDVKTGKLREIYTHDDPDELSECWSIQPYNGELWVVESLSGGENLLHRIDPETLAVTTTELERYMTFLPYEDRLMADEYIEDGDDWGYRVIEYSAATDSWNDLYGGTMAKEDKKSFHATDDGIITVELDDDRRCTICSDNFRLETGMRCDFDAYSAGRVTVSSKDRNKMYVYDLNKMERYDYDMSTIGTGSRTAFGEDLIVTNMFGSKSYYLMPEYGVCYELLSTDYTSAIVSGKDCAWIYGWRSEGSGDDYVRYDIFCNLKRK